MEREYIERNAVLEEALNNKAVRAGLTDETDIKEIISDIPSADVVSVREYQGLADENRELKRLLKLAIDDFDLAMNIGKCDVCGNSCCEATSICKWRYKSEAMKLLKGENVQSFADVQPVIHSKWEISSDGYYPYCKKCNARPENGKMTKYCPNCGAKMDGD